MTPRPSSRLLVHAGLATLALVAGLASRRVDLLVYATPSVVILLLGSALAGQVRVDVSTAVTPERALEGDVISLAIDVAAPRAVRHVELALVLPPGVRPLDGRDVRHLSMGGDGMHRVVVEVVADRWGVHPIGAVVVRAVDRGGLHLLEGGAGQAHPVRIYPLPHRLDELASPARPRRIAGDRVARRQVGEGLELADLRPFRPGDRPRDVNWRVSARRGDLWVTERHPDRSTDVVLFVDTFADAVLVPAVRAATSLAEAYLATRDRVGMVGFGGLLRWVRAGQGTRQRYRILDALLDARSAFSYAWKDVSVIPPGVLVPGALVLALSPLEDERTLAALVDLRARGFEVAVVELDLAALLPEPRKAADRAARKLWLAQRASQRGQLRQFGIPVARWRDGDHLGTTMEELWDGSGGRGAHRHASRVP